MGKSCFQALKRVMCKREPWEGTERWWRLYMSLFCQIPISLGSSCYRPNSRGPLLLPTPFLLPQRDPNRLSFGDREQSRQSSQVAGLRLISLFSPTSSSPASIPQLAWAADREPELLDSSPGLSFLLGIPVSCFSLPFCPSETVHPATLSCTPFHAGMTPLRISPE